MNTTSQEFEISGMTCGHCVMTVEKTLKNIAGVQSAKVSLENKNAVVVFDSELTNSDRLTAAFEQTNYKAKVK